MDVALRTSGRFGRVIELLEAHTNKITYASMGFVLVAGSALAVREGSELAYFDEREYLTMADNFVEHHRYTVDGINPTAYKPPVWPLLLGFLRWLGFGVVGLRVANVVMLAACVLLGSLLARRIAGRTAGTLAAVAIAVFPVGLYASTTLYPQVLGAGLVLGALLLATAVPDSPRPGRLAVGIGACFGILILTVPSLAVVFAGVLALLWFTARSRAWPLIITAVVVAAVLPMAWAVRNTVQMEAFVPIATVDGVQLLNGNNAKARPDTGPTVDTSEYEEYADEQNMNEVDETSYYREVALTWIRDNPGDAASLYVGKLVQHFGYKDTLQTATESSSSRDLIVAVTYYPLLLLVGLRFVLARRYRLSPVEIVIVGWYIVNAFVTAVYFPRIRYRLSADIPLLVEAAVAVVVLLAWYLHRGDGASAAEEPVLASDEGAVRDNAPAR
jgi:4-amino-4-deoxy-L-arabinose transferase-like glycosyltransferase